MTVSPISIIDQVWRTALQARYLLLETPKADHELQYHRVLFNCDRPPFAPDPLDDPGSHFEKAKPVFFQPFQLLATASRLMAFTDVVPVPFRNSYGNIALNDRLASKAGMELVIGRLFHAVELVVIHFGQVGVALLDYNMARCARTASTARVLEMEPEVHRNIQQRFRLAMSFIR
jgi:hypothetical protein